MKARIHNREINPKLCRAYASINADPSSSGLLDSCDSIDPRELTLEEARRLFRIISWNDIRLLSINWSSIEIVMKNQSIRVAASESETIDDLLYLLRRDLPLRTSPGRP